jgi:hypothetical protein
MSHSASFTTSVATTEVTITGFNNGVCRHPADQVPPRTSSRSRQKVRHVNHMLPRVHNLNMNRIAQGSSEATTCPAAPARFGQPEHNTLRPRVKGVVLLCLSARLRSSLFSPYSLLVNSLCDLSPSNKRTTAVLLQ